MDNDLNMDFIAWIVREKYDTPCVVSQSGGGVATIYAGIMRKDEAGDMRAAACAGPGSYGWEREPSMASTCDFYVGPEDEGQGGYVAMDEIGALTEADVAKVIAAQAAKGAALPVGDPAVSLSFDEIEALGFDGTGRGGHL